MIREDRTYAAVCDQCGYEEPADLSETGVKLPYPPRWYHLTVDQQFRHADGWTCSLPCALNYVDRGKTKEALI